MKFRFVTILSLLIALTICASASTPTKVYVGSMGHSDEAERFRMLVRTELEKLSIATVDNADDADAVLTGIIAVKVDERGHATLELKDRSGKRLWSGDFAPGIWARYDEVKTRAKKVAKELKKVLDGLPPRS
jgi:hypothetical protein